MDELLRIRFKFPLAFLEFVGAGRNSTPGPNGSL